VIAMPQLIVTYVQGGCVNEQRYCLAKRMTSVGTELSHDIVVDSVMKGVLFTVMQNTASYELVPGRVRVRINGQGVSRASGLSSCDRIEWEDGCAVFLDSSVPVAEASGGGGRTSSSLKPLEVLQNIASTLQSPGGAQTAIYQTLDALVEMSGAETGYLLSEMGSSGGGAWEMVASHKPEVSSSRRELVSNTILKEAIEKRRPVYVESIIGHPWSDAASVIEAKIFSAACFPLIVGEKVFGAVLLFTRTPGRAIRRDTLGDLSLLAAQSALMLASRAELRFARRENARLRELVRSGDGSALVYDVSRTDSAMAELDRRISKIAPTPLSVIILGETGSGKEIVARELHLRSGRSKGPFVAVNCAAIPATLLESTLFGYERGAFTGAERSQPGKFALASGGTLFLDEIGEIPPELQSKLLRALQEKQIEPLGSRRPVAIDARIIAATHKDIDAAVRDGGFRQDLYYRLNGATVRIAPLRERVADIRPLAAHFLKLAGVNKDISTDAFLLLEKHSWPGNVRELEQVVTRAALLGEGAGISADDLELDAPVAAASGDSGVFWEGMWDFGSLEEAQGAFTHGYVRRMLERGGGNRTLTARRLGISERTLYRLLSTMGEG